MSPSLFKRNIRSKEPKRKGGREEGSEMKVLVGRNVSGSLDCILDLIRSVGKSWRRCGEGGRLICCW